jgi:flagellar biosynthesis GTPase FlhF
MSDIFVSYASEDRERIMPLVHALEKTEWSVFWDRTIPTGKTWREVIGSEIRSSRSIVVVWSKNSVDSRWVQEEAEAGSRKHKLFPILIEDVEQPFGFGSIQAASFIDWDGKPEAQSFQRLIADLTTLLGESPAAVAEAKRKAKEEERKRAADENKLKAEKEAKRKAEVEEQKRIEEDRERMAAEEESRRDEDAKRKAEEEISRQEEEEEAKRKAEEDERRRVDEAKRKGEEEQQRAEEVEKEKSEVPSGAKVTSKSYVPWLIGGAVIIILAGIFFFRNEDELYAPPSVVQKPVPEVTQPIEKEVPKEEALSSKNAVPNIEGRYDLVKGATVFTDNSGDRYDYIAATIIIEKISDVDFGFVLATKAKDAKENDGGFTPLGEYGVFSYKNGKFHMPSRNIELSIDGDRLKINFITSNAEHQYLLRKVDPKTSIYISLRKTLSETEKNYKEHLGRNKYIK